MAAKGLCPWGLNLAAVDEVGDPATGRSRRHWRTAMRSPRTFLVWQCLRSSCPPLCRRLRFSREPIRRTAWVDYASVRRSDQPGPFCALHHRV